MIGLTLKLASCPASALLLNPILMGATCAYAAYSLWDLIDQSNKLKAENIKTVESTGACVPSKLNESTCLSEAESAIQTTTPSSGSGSTGSSTLLGHCNQPSSDVCTHYHHTADSSSFASVQSSLSTACGAISGTFDTTKECSTSGATGQCKSSISAQGLPIQDVVLIYYAPTFSADDVETACKAGDGTFTAL